MGQLLSNLAGGSLVKLNENGHPVKFIKLDNGHYGTGSGVTLIRKDTFNERQWEACYDGSYKNRYIGCLLDNFCDLMWPQMLDPEVKECMVPVPIVVAEGNGVSTLHTIYRKGFALSCTEVGVSGWQTEGRGLRSPYSGTNYACYIRPDGTVSYNYVYVRYFAPRPAFNLKSSIVVSSAKDAEGCYTLESVPVAGGGAYVKQNGVWVRAV